MIIDKRGIARLAKMTDVAPEVISKILGRLQHVQRDPAYGLGRFMSTQLAKKEADREQDTAPPDENETDPGDDTPTRKKDKKSKAKEKEPVDASDDEDEASAKPQSHVAFEKMASGLRPIPYLTPDMADTAVSLGSEARYRAETHPNGAPVIGDDQYWLAVGASAAMIGRAARVRRGEVPAGWHTAPPIKNAEDYPQGYEARVKATARQILNCGCRRRGEKERF